MKTDIEIAQEAVMLPIKEIAAKLDITEDDLELYGKYKAKLSDELMTRVKDNPDGKLILVTAINPTPAGEGKTTTSVGLGQAFGKLGKRAVIALREPSLGPCFGIKGGAAGGGYAQVVQWKTLICILPEIFQQLPPQTTCLQLCLTTISSRAMSLALTQDRWYGNAVSI